MTTTSGSDPSPGGWLASSGMPPARFIYPLLENIHAMIITMALDGTILAFNPAAERLLGYRAEEVVGKLTSTLFHDPDELARWAEQLSQELGVMVAPGFEALAARQAEAEQREWTFIRKDGTHFPASLSMIPLRDEGGRLVGYLGIGVEDGPRRQREAELERIGRLHQLILESAGDGVFGLDREGRTSFINPAAARMLGWEQHELLGQLQHNLIHHTRADGSPYPREECPIYAAFHDGQVHQISGEVFWRKDGSSFPVEYSSTPLIEQGAIVGAVVAFRDITEQRRTAQALEQARLAEAANLAKSQFLSRMSHELRTPMNSVLGFAQLLEMSELTPSQRESVEHILRAGHHLLELINEVLDLARIEAGRVAIEIAPAPLDELIQEALDLVGPLAARQRIAIHPQAALASGARVLADRQRLRQILLNLLSNAVKYNRPGGGVFVSCEERAGGTMRLLIRDTGYGIPPEALPRLFQPFERLDAGLRGIEGTGLGLALCQQLVVAMGGAIGVESAPGVGSTFWVELPLVAEEPALAPEMASPRALTLLHIDDNPLDLKLLSLVLRDWPGMLVLAAPQGELGLDLARERHPDLIVLDLELPDLRGEEVLRQLQEDPRTHDIPVIILSSESDRRQQKQLLVTGARVYLVKPLHAARFLQLIGEVLGAPPR